MLIFCFTQMHTSTTAVVCLVLEVVLFCLVLSTVMEVRVLSWSAATPSLHTTHTVPTIRMREFGVNTGCTQVKFVVHTTQTDLTCLKMTF